MRAKQLIEKLEDLATFFTMAEKDARENEKANELRGAYTSASIWEGRKLAYKTAFNKVDGIIKEARK